MEWHASQGFIRICTAPLVAPYRPTSARRICSSRRRSLGHRGVSTPSQSADAAIPCLCVCVCAASKQPGLGLGLGLGIERSLWCLCRRCRQAGTRQARAAPVITGPVAGPSSAGSAAHSAAAVHSAAAAPSFPLRWYAPALPPQQQGNTHPPPACPCRIPRATGVTTMTPAFALQTAATTAHGSIYCSVHSIILAIR